MKIEYNGKKFNINNELLTIPEICRKFNIPKTTFSNRYYRDKDSIEDIIKQGNKMKTIIDLLLNDKNINQNFKEVLKGEKNGIIKKTNGRNY